MKVLQASEQDILTQHTRREADSVNRGVQQMADCFIHETAVVDGHCRIGKGTRIWHFSHVLANSVIGEDCILGQNVMVGPDVSIGNHCKIQNNVSIYKGITLEDGVFCGPSCVVHQRQQPPRRTGEERPVRAHAGQAGCDHRRQCHHPVRR